MSKIAEFHKVRIEPYMEENRNEHQIYVYLTRLVSEAHRANMASSESFCFKFNLPMMAVNRLYTMMGITPIEIKILFESEWGKKLTHMHQDPYYQILLLILYHSIVKNKDPLSQNALMLILMKVWNGRKSKFFKYCDPKVMNYVISHMISKRHVTGKYDTPATLLNNYFAPTIMTKYGIEVRRDPRKLQRLFEQCYARVYQLFVFNPRVDPRTGDTKASGGLLPLYMKVKEDNLHVKIRTGSGGAAGTEESGFDEYILSNNRDDVINKTTDFIVLNDKIHYPNSLLNDINQKTHVSTKVIDSILKAINKQEHYELIKNIIVIFLSRVEMKTADDLCSPSFKEKVQKSIIGSKNNIEMQKLHKILDLLLKRIFEKELQLNFERYSSVHKMKIKNVIIYALEHTLVRVNCRGA